MRQGRSLVRSGFAIGIARLGLGCWMLLSAIGWTSCQAERSTPTASVPDERALYAMMTQGYTSWDALAGIRDISADEAGRRLKALQAINPPPGLELLHEQAVDAYQHVCNGKLLLIGADSVLRSEAFFMVDWGLARLVDYREHLDGLLQGSADSQ
jgi:hypothetical protein